MNLFHQTRRAFLGRAATGLGSVALASLLDSRLLAGEAPSKAGAGRYQGVVNPRHFPPKAKRVIYLYMAGGPSHLETFDYKPKLAEMNGKPMPESITKGQPIAQLQGAKLNCFAPQHPFKKCGKSGQEIADIFPHMGEVADELCIIRSHAHRGDQPRPGPHLHEHRHDHLRPAEHGFVGCGTASAATATTCPASWC